MGVVKLLEVSEQTFERLEAFRRRKRLSREAALRLLLDEALRRERLIAEVKRARPLSEEEEERAMQEANAALAWARRKLRRTRKGR